MGTISPLHIDCHTDPPLPPLLRPLLHPPLPLLYLLLLLGIPEIALEENPREKQNIQAE